LAQNTSQRYHPTEEQIEEQRRTAQLRIEADIKYAAISPAKGSPAMPIRIDSGTHTVYNLSGANNRINIDSEDSSTNIVNVTPTELFRDLRGAIEAQLADAEERGRILEKLEAFERAQSTPTFYQRYVDFMAATANHATVILPFLPALSQLFHPGS
jgi:hypothetical protein